MFEKNPENAAALVAAWKVLEELGRGDLFSHEIAEKALGTGRTEDRYYSLIECLKKRMEHDRGISLVSIMLVGYTLATADEQLEFARSRVKRAGRQFSKARRTVQSLPQSECTMSQQRAKVVMEDQLAENEKKAREESRLFNFLLRPHDSNPRRPTDLVIHSELPGEVAI